MTDARLMEADCIHGKVWFECGECGAGPEIICNWHGIGMVQGDVGWSCPMCPNPAAADEIERLRAENEHLRLMVGHGITECDNACSVVKDLQAKIDAWAAAFQEGVDRLAAGLAAIQAFVASEIALLAAATPKEDDRA